MGPTEKAVRPGALVPEPRPPTAAPADLRTVATAEGGAAPESGDRFQEEVTGYVRSPSDVLRTVVFTLAALLLVVLGLWSRDAVLSLDVDLVQRLSFMTPTVGRIVSGVLTWSWAASSRCCCCRGSSGCSTGESRTP
jgi:hypothetical protein